MGSVFCFLLFLALSSSSALRFLLASVEDELLPVFDEAPSLTLGLGVAAAAAAAAAAETPEVIDAGDPPEGDA